MKKRRKRKNSSNSSSVDFGRTRYIDFILGASIFLLIFLTNVSLAKIEFLQPDSSGYLDMGRNLFSGRGAFISYNLNQYWPGKYYPFLPYIQPIYGIIAGFIWIFFGLKAVIGFNIFLHAINYVLLFAILRLYSDRITSFLIAVFMAFSPDLIFSAIAPLTEELHLFFLFFAILAYVRYKDANFWVGVILALSCLVRISSIYNVIAFLLAMFIIKGFSKEAFKGYGKALLGFLMILGTYELFCYYVYGVFYPEYLTAAKIYRSAEIYPGAFYKIGIPVLNMPPLKLSIDAIGKNILSNLTGFIKGFGVIKFIMPLAVIFFIFDILKKKTPVIIILFLQGFAIFLGYALIHGWSPIYEFSRFSMITIITLGGLGFLAIRETADWLFLEIKKPFVISIALFAAIFAVFAYIEFKEYASFRKNCDFFLQRNITYRKQRDEIHQWIKRNTENDDLIASDYLADAFLLERPFVSLPPGEALNEKNIKRYLDIFKPECVLTYNETLAVYLKNVGFREVMKKEQMILLQR